MDLLSKIFKQRVKKMIPLAKINSVLIVCTGNICRSPMGEGVLKYKFDQVGLSHIGLNSAGTSGWDKCKPIADAIQACQEIEIDISSLRSDPITEQMIQDADLILAMEKEHIDTMIKQYHATDEKLFLLGDFHPDKPGMEIEDPYGRTIMFYREVLDIICQCSDGLIETLVKSN